MSEVSVLEQQRLEAAGVALLDAVTKWSWWCHRRIDSVHPLEGTRGRQRHSIDCTLPTDTGLSYVSHERFYIRATRSSPIMVPLAFLRKGPLRHFDASIADTAMPVLGRSETTNYSIAVLLERLKLSGLTVTDKVLEAVETVISPAGASLAAETLDQLLNHGRWEGETIFPSHVVEDRAAMALIGDFAKNFLLIGLAPIGYIGTRQILKFSFSWELVSAKLRDTFRLRSLLGLTPAELEIPMIMPDGTASYHLEFHTPLELECSKLRLPAVVTDDVKQDLVQTHAAADDDRAPIAHVHGTFDAPPEEQHATVELYLPFRGLKATATTAIFTVATIFALALFLPGAVEALRSSSDGAVALLLAVPAAFIGYLAATRESTLVAATHRPLRGMTLLSSWSLLAMAGSIVGGLQIGWLHALWITGLMVNGSMLVVTISPHTVKVSRRFINVYRE